MTLTKEDLQAIASLIDKKLDDKLQPVNNRLDSMDNRIEKLDSEVSALKVGQKELAKEIRQVKDKVNATYDLALEAWGQSTENRVWLETKVGMP
jgi:archaellum component FlaC